MDLNNSVSATPTVLSTILATAIFFGTVGYFAGLGSSLGHSVSRKGTINAGKVSGPIEEAEDSESGEVTETKDFSDVKGECKLVLAVRADLNMGRGKAAAQVGHATLACYKKVQKSSPALLRRWEVAGQPKICVKIDSEEELEMLQAQALSLGITAAVIHDAGRTQIAAGSATVVGIGPAPKAIVDQVTGHLKLL